MSPRVHQIAIVGSGPAALMAASHLAGENHQVFIFEKRKAYGRKLLIAGSSGLNISHHLALPEFARHYQGFDLHFWQKLLQEYSCEDWLRFIQNELGLETFLGTSDRYFVREMKAANLLRTWIQKLEAQGVTFSSQQEWVGMTREQGRYRLYFDQGQSADFDSVVFAMGGASWLGDEGETPRWVENFIKLGIQVTPFSASNVGYEVPWKESFLKEAEGKPLKKISLTTSKGSKLGELVVTHYGLEGTPIYFLGTPGEAFLDLKPDLTLEQMRERVEAVKENLSPIRRVHQRLGLSDAAQALVFHQLEADIKNDLQKLLAHIKRFPLRLVRARPLSESISSRGGVGLSQVSDDLELQSFPGVFVAGEMLDWDAPTGGFLIQACISQGARAASGVRKYLSTLKA